ncbi:MAG: hypothetical protein ACYS0F_05640 [Planctomycetota bacterium]|jgi:hypothetical protein
METGGAGDQMANSRQAEPVQIDRGVPRALFAELLAGALQKVKLKPSPMAIAYLVELLDERLLENRDGLEGEQALAEALLVAQRDQGVDRIRRMRGLGDHALFVSGFLADSLLGGAVDANYYRQIGCSAYRDVVNGLRCSGESGVWTRLYRELVDDFGEFVEVLAEVGDRTRPGLPQNLLGVYDRYLRTGSARDRELLQRAGHPPPDRSGLRWWQ